MSEHGGSDSGVGIGASLDQAWNEFASLVDVGSVSHPELLQLALLLVVGFIGGRIASDVVLRFLQMTPLDELGVKSDVQVLLRKLSYRGSVSTFIADTIRWGIYALTLLAVSSIFGSDLLARYSERAISWGSQIVMAVLIIIIGGIIADRIGRFVTQMLRVGRISGRVDESHAEIPLYVVVGLMVKYMGYVITGIVTMGFLGVNPMITNILIAALVLGIVFAMIVSSRHLLRNIAVSLYFQTSRMFRGGEHVRIGQYNGTIESIRPMYTEISGKNTTYYIPNTQLVSDVVEFPNESAVQVTTDEGEVAPADANTETGADAADTSEDAGPAA